MLAVNCVCLVINTVGFENEIIQGGEETDLKDIQDLNRLKSGFPLASGSVNVANTLDQGGGTREAEPPSVTGNSNVKSATHHLRLVERNEVRFITKNIISFRNKVRKKGEPDSMKRRSEYTFQLIKNGKDGQEISDAKTIIHASQWNAKLYILKHDIQDSGRKLLYVAVYHSDIHWDIRIVKLNDACANNFLNLMRSSSELEIFLAKIVSFYERNANASPMVAPISYEHIASTVGPVPVLQYRRRVKVWNLPGKTH
ncbi:hypothetical protein POM88_025133 [Heracleum sosnowskyi]|uniref:Uncharacterized protein n=1 Tax=Heracleum sosnowskyi TaxID=360622 RepID=A0AAD8I4P9_9APIA|nr:hypothetical protein POM88_025133 [Heracleum sosnowskyi]